MNDQAIQVGAQVYDAAALLQRLTLQALQPALLARVNGSCIYQIAQAWQRDSLLADAHIVAVRTIAQLERAVQDTDIHTIFVLKDSLISQAATQAVLMRNVPTQTILWEV